MINIYHTKDRDDLKKILSEKGTFMGKYKDPKGHQFELYNFEGSTFIVNLNEIVVGGRLPVSVKYSVGQLNNSLEDSVSSLRLKEERIKWE